MRKNLLSIWICILTLIVIFLTGCEINPPSNEYTQISNNNKSMQSIPYPRLAMWWLNPYEATAKEMARYDLLLNEFDDPFLFDKLEEIRQLNPSQILLRPISPSEHQIYTYGSDSIPNPAIAKLPSAFFLLHQGAKLVESVDDTERIIKVDRIFDENGNPLFYVGDDIAIGDYESARIQAIDNGAMTLEVIRGHIRQANTHSISENVNAHVRFWPNSWVMNITSACPELIVQGVDYPVDYITYFHLLIQNKVEGLYPLKTDNPYFIYQGKVQYDGFVLDRFEDHQSWLKWVDEQPRDLDPYQNQTILTDEAFDALTVNTVDQFTQLLRETYGECIIIRNNPLTVRADLHDGQVYESFGWDNPNREWWRNLFITSNKSPDQYVSLSYLEWFKLKKAPIVLMEVYEDERGADSDGDGVYQNPLEDSGYQIDEKKMRFSLTSTLMGDGFYSYEINTNGHGSLGLLWFDTYDLGVGEKGYLGFPKGEMEEITKDVFMRKFDNGIVVVNVSDHDYMPKFESDMKPAKGFEIGSNGEINPYDGCIYLYDSNHSGY